MISSNFPNKNTLYIYDNISGHYRSITNEDLIKSIEKTSNNELTIAKKHIIIDIPSTYGVSQLKDETGVFFNATIQENSGLLELQTNNETGSNCYIQSIARTNTQFGATSESLFGIKINNEFTGRQYAQWGSYDGINGAGYGIDQSGLYIFKLINSNYIKIHQQNWNLNTLSGENNNYEFNTLNSGNIYGVDINCHIVKNFIITKNKNNNNFERVNVHSWDNNGLLIDTNQPLRAEINNSTDVGQSKISIKNRSSSIIGGANSTQSRPIVDSITKYTISAAQDVWEPIMAVRRKENFGPSNRNNSINAKIHKVSILSDQDSEFMVTVNGNVTGTNWVNPEFRDLNESACEVQKITNNNLGIQKTGQCVIKEALFASNKHDSETKSLEEIYFGNGGEAILFARRTTSNATIVSATVHWDEEY